MFEIRPTKSYKMTNAHIFEKSGKIPVVTNSSRDNGITGYTSLKPTEAGGIITYSDTTTSEGIFYQPDDFVGYSHIQGLYPKGKNSWNEKSLLYFVSLFRKSAGGRFDYANKFNRENAKSLMVLLPVNRKSNIDFDYMERYISELEEERVSELAAYLKVTGLENCILTKPEKLALKSRGGSNLRKFKIGDLFEKLSLKIKNKDFNKKKDVSKEKTSEFSLPLINAKHTDNGIMFYGRESDFEYAEMAIDVIQNGAIATGDVFIQPQKTGVLWDAYLIKYKSNNLSVEHLLYFAQCIEKSIKQKFSYDNKATWEKVEKCEIEIPSCNDGIPDYEFMETYIRALEKVVIKGVMNWKDRIIKTTKEIVYSK